MLCRQIRKPKISVILILVLMISLLLPMTKVEGLSETARIISLEGSVKVMRGGGEKPFDAFVNMRITEGDRVITGSDGEARIQIGDDRVVIIAENTRIFFSELRRMGKDQQTSVSLEAGGIGSIIRDRLTRNSRFEIRTPTAIMGARGTEYFTQYRNGQTNVRVLAGLVEVNISDRSDQTSPMMEGQEKLVSFILEPMQQSGFREEDSAEKIMASKTQLTLDEMEPALLQRMKEFDEEQPKTLPDDISNSLDEAIEKAKEKQKEFDDTKENIIKDIQHRLPSDTGILKPFTPPGQEGTPPGQEGTPPGQEGTPPGQEGTPPGQEATPPGQEATSPGQGGTPPGQEATPSGQEKTPPGQERTPPGQSTAPGQTSLDE